MINMVVWTIAKIILLFEILGNYYLCLYPFHVIKLSISGKESTDGKGEINQRIGFSFIMFKYTQIWREAYGCQGRLLNITLRNVSSHIECIGFQWGNVSSDVNYRSHSMPQARPENLEFSMLKMPELKFHS